MRLFAYVFVGNFLDGKDFNAFARAWETNSLEERYFTRCNVSFDHFSCVGVCSRTQASGKQDVAEIISEVIENTSLQTISLANQSSALITRKPNRMANRMMKQMTRFA